MHIHLLAGLFVVNGFSLKSQSVKVRKVQAVKQYIQIPNFWAFLKSPSLSKVRWRVFRRILIEDFYMCLELADYQFMPTLDAFTSEFLRTVRDNNRTSTLFYMLLIFNT